MAYVVVISLSYDNHTQEQCSRIWRLIKNAMLDAGFQPDGRLFTINLPEKDAITLARETVERVGRDLLSSNEDMYGYLKRFYGYDVAHTTNLLLPPVDSIEVEEKI